MKWLLLLPLLLVACAPAYAERLARLEAQVQAQEIRSCKALYLAWAAMVKVGVAEDRSLKDPLPGCPTWAEVNR